MGVADTATSATAACSAAAAGPPSTVRRRSRSPAFFDSSASVGVLPREPAQPLLGRLHQTLPALHQLLGNLPGHAGHPARHPADRLECLGQHLRQLIGPLSGLTGLRGGFRRARLGQLLALAAHCGRGLCRSGSSSARARWYACAGRHTGHSRRLRCADTGGGIGDQGVSRRFRRPLCLEPAELRDCLGPAYPLGLCDCVMGVSGTPRASASPTPSGCSRRRACATGRRARTSGRRSR